MTKQGANNPWREQLLSHLQKRRAEQPLPQRAALSPVEEQQCRILGGHLISWLQDYGPRLLRERAAFPLLHRGNRSPTVLFVTDRPGMAAAQEILSPRDGQVVACLREEFAALSKEEQDPEFMEHCELQSYFERVPVGGAERELRHEHGVSVSGELWTHYECSLMGTLFARGARHLWRFGENGEEVRLLKEAHDQWIS